MDSNVIENLAAGRSMKRISKFLRICTDPAIPKSFGVISNDKSLIAVIAYHSPWRQWAIYPQPNTVWSTDCLAAINSHLEGLNQKPKLDDRINRMDRIEN